MISQYCCSTQAELQPLHMAAKNGHIDVAQYLVLECKVSLDSVAKV